MNKLNYYLKIYIIFVIILITSCSLFKKDKENIEQGNTNFFFETVAKPDPSLKGIKVRLPKPSINKTWMQSTNNQAHFVEHPLVQNKIKFSSLYVLYDDFNRLNNKPSTFKKFFEIFKKTL